MPTPAETTFIARMSIKKFYLSEVEHLLSIPNGNTKFRLTANRLVIRQQVRRGDNNQPPVFYKTSKIPRHAATYSEKTMRKLTSLFPLLGFSLPLISCSPMIAPPSNYDAALVNNRQQRILFLQNDQIINIQGQALAQFEGDTLYNLGGQALGTISAGSIRNLQNQELGSVSGNNLLNLNGKAIMSVEGSLLPDREKVAAGFFFLL